MDTIVLKWSRNTCHIPRPSLRSTTLYAYPKLICCLSKYHYHNSHTRIELPRNHFDYKVENKRVERAILTKAIWIKDLQMREHGFGCLCHISNQASFRLGLDDKIRCLGLEPAPLCSWDDFLIEYISDCISTTLGGGTVAITTVLTLNKSIDRIAQIVLDTDPPAFSRVSCSNQGGFQTRMIGCRRMSK